MLDLILTGAGLQNLPDQTDRIVACELILFVSCIGLAYYFHPPLARRFSMAIHALTLVSIAGGQITVILPLQLLLSVTIAYAVSFVLVLVPFPRLAGDELLDRWRQAVDCLSSLLVETVDAWLAVDCIVPMVLHTSAASRLDGIFSSLTVMRRLQMEAAREAEVFTTLFPASISVASVVEADPDRVEHLYWIVRNLLHTLSTLRYSAYHGPFVTLLRPSFTEFAGAASDYLRMLATDQPALVTVERVDLARKRLDAALDAVWEGFTEARHQVYVAKQRVEEDAAPKAGELHYRADPIPSPVDGVEEHLRLLVRTEADDARRVGKQFQSPTLSASTHDVFLRSSFLFYLQRFHSACLRIKVKTDVIAPIDHSSFAASSFSPSSSSPLSKRSPRSVKAERKRRFIKARLSDSMRTPWTWSVLGFRPVSDAFALVWGAWTFVRHPKVDLMWLRNSVKIALIICVASLIAVIPQVATDSALPNSVWACFTAAILTSDTEGALWQRAGHRLFGTLLGGLIGYLILLAYPTDWLGSVALLSVWVLLMQFVQASSFAYLGALASFTPIVIVFGHQQTASGASLTPERYALAREEEIAIGIVIALLISTVLWPTSSIRLIRSEVMLSLEAFQAGITSTLDVYESLSSKHEALQRARAQPADPAQLLEEGKRVDPLSTSRAAVVDEAKDAGGGAGVDEEDALLNAMLTSSSAVQMSVSRQLRLLGEAVNEPVTFFWSFPTAAYQELIAVQRRVWALVTTLEPALRDVLYTQATAVARVEQQLFDLPVFRSHLQQLIKHTRHVLAGCVEALRTGRPNQDAAREVVKQVHEMEAGFASTMNDMAKRVREGRTRFMDSRAIVPITAFIYCAIALAEQVLVLEASVNRLLQLEQPQTYDD